MDILLSRKVSSKDKVKLLMGDTQRIFPYRKIPNDAESTQAEVYISMEYDSILRQERGKTNAYFKRSIVAMYILVNESLESTLNGSRSVCIEQCIENALHNKPIESISKCFIVESKTIGKPPKGYVGRIVYLSFADTNEGAISGD